jgi:very-short-patch-repair endonuclease
MDNLTQLKNKKLDFTILNKHSNNDLRKKYVRELITKQLLEELIIDNNFSCLLISNILRSIGIKTNAGFIIKLAKEFNIKTLSLKESANSPFVRKKYKETCLEKYGEENALSKNTSCYYKRNSTVKDRYKVSNVFQLNSIKEKSKISLFKKYGVYNTAELPFFQRNNGRRSKIQILVENYLDECNIFFEVEIGKKFRKFNNVFNKIYSPVVDILIESKKIIIEIYGDKWHANPLIYKDSDLIETWSGKLFASEIRKKDLERKKHLESFGYKVIEIWEKDIRRNFGKVKEIINEM